MIRKKLIFMIYATDDILKSDVMEIHWYCMKKYFHIFDTAVFVIKVDDILNYSLINKVESKILEILPMFQNITFKVEENDEFRDAGVFYREVIQKLEIDDTDIIFFGHNKGMTNDKTESIKMWITAMYYFNFIDNVSEIMVNTPRFKIYGALLTYVPNNSNVSHYGKIFSGGFLWLHKNFINEYIKYNNIKLCLYDRFFVENFPSYIFKTDELFDNYTLTYHCKYLSLYEHGDRWYYDCENLLKILYTEDESKDFFEFFNNEIKNIKYIENE